MKYRNIDARNTVVSEGNYTKVKQILEAAGWNPMPTNRKQGDVFINPVMDEAKEDIQALRDIAPYIERGHDVFYQETPESNPDCQIILEIEHGSPFNPKTWLHLIYDGKGGVKEIESPAHQWDEPEN